jgi:anti-anti-sigma factor
MQPARLFLNETRGRGERVIRPAGELTDTTEGALRASVTRAISQGAHRIVLDLSSVGRIDGKGRDALVECSRAVRAARATLVVSAAPGHVRALLRASDREMDARDDLADALLIGADELAVEHGRRQEDAGKPVCGAFVHRTPTGHAMVCALGVGHGGDHQWR